MMKRNVLYSLSAFVFLAGAVSAWKTIPVGASGTEIKPAAAHDEVAGFAESGTGKKPAVTALPASKLSYEAAYADYMKRLYKELNLDQEELDQEVFNKALTGFYNLKAKGKLTAGKDVLTIVDFTRSSREKRMWIIDLGQKQLIYRTLVAHGQGSGANKATSFSNTESSHQSSLGFYVTGEVYYGKHGRSLRLDGMDPGFNSNARKRAIVLHGADYVSQAFINRAGRLGRSFGCPAVPQQLCDGIIDKISEKTVLFINGPGEKYQSDHLNVTAAARYLLPVSG